MLPWSSSQTGWGPQQTWNPPKMLNRSLCVGVDPPGAWAIWCMDGVLASGVGENEMLAGRQLNDAIRQYGLQGRRYLMVGVERPWGVKVAGGEKAIIKNAIACGYWIRHLESSATVTWSPMANQWRRWVGIHGQGDELKKLALKMTTVLAELQGEPARPTTNHNEAEARLIAMATWMRAGCIVHGDLVHRWMLKFNVPYRQPSLQWNIEMKGRGDKMVVVGHGGSRRKAWVPRPALKEKRDEDQGDEGPF